MPRILGHDLPRYVGDAARRPRLPPLERTSYPQTLMMYDIAALQYMYGANFNTNSRQHRLQLEPDHRRDVRQRRRPGTPGGQPASSDVWDGGGTDTYDFSNYATNLDVDLRPGRLDDNLSQAQLADLG